jgi:hypothetical protein
MSSRCSAWCSTFAGCGLHVRRRRGDPDGGELSNNSKRGVGLLTLVDALRAPASGSRCSDGPDRHRGGSMKARCNRAIDTDLRSECPGCGLHADTSGIANLTQVREEGARSRTHPRSGKTRPAGWPCGDGGG